MEYTLDRKRAHLRLIRAIANRMRAGSALLEIWSVATVAALLAVATYPEYARYAWLALFMALAFWMLDAWMSQKERLFRKIYARVWSLPEAQLDFDLNTAAVDDEATSFSTVFWSTALGAFHGSIVASIIVARVLLARG